MRRDATSVTLEGAPIQQQQEMISVIQRDGGRLEVVYTTMEVRVTRSEVRGRTMDEVVTHLKLKGWK